MCTRRRKLPEVVFHQNFHELVDRNLRGYKSCFSAYDDNGAILVLSFVLARAGGRVDGCARRRRRSGQASAFPFSDYKFGYIHACMYRPPHADADVDAVRCPGQINSSEVSSTVRLKIIGNDTIKNVGKYESCMISKLPIIFKRTRKCISLTLHLA